MPQHDIDNWKLVNVTPPAALIDNASATTEEVDTQGWNRARYIIQLGATDIALTALHVTQSDSAGSGHAEITTSDFTDSDNTDIEGNALALPDADADSDIIVIDVNLEGKKRYLDLVLTVGDGTQGAYVSVLCQLYRGESGPTTNAEHGAATVVRV